jgi:Na+/melibiose symporter-like transporter
VIVAFAVYGVGIAGCQALMWALQADTVDYGEW